MERAQAIQHRKGVTIMSAPSDREKRLCEMFDSYCKSAQDNTSKYLLRKMATRAQREEIHDPDVMIGLFPQEDEYPSHRFIVFADELTCVVSNEIIYKALMSMPEKQRKVLILDFWHDWKDKQIAEYLEVTLRTVYNLRQRAYRTIQRFHDEKGQEL